MIITSIHQPSLFPWLGLLDKIAKTNLFVLLDHVKVVKGTNQYRNQFYCNGLKKFLTLPINLHSNSTFLNTELKHYNWIEEHLEKLHNYYRKADFFNEIFKEVEVLYLSLMMILFLIFLRNQ
jgi:hypothetical protein